MLKVQEPLFTARDAAEYLGLSLKTVRLYVTRNVLTPCQKIGSTWLLAQSELDRFKQERRTPGRPKSESHNNEETSDE